MRIFFPKVLTYTIVFGYILTATLLCVGTTVHAVEYVPLVGLPGFMDKSQQDIPGYINALYLLTIGIGALMGVVRIAMAGIKYALTDIVTQKSDAKHDIQGVLLGLAILLIPFIVLSTINPNLTKLDVLHGVKVNLSKGSGATPDTKKDTPSSFWDVPVGSTVKVCESQIKYSPDCANLPDVMRKNNPSCLLFATYDTTACAAECATLGGTFDKGAMSSRCIYKET